MKTVTVDLGGTRCRAAVVDDDGQISGTRRRPTPSSDPDPGFLVDMVLEVLHGHRAPDPASVVLGVPGIVDHENEALLAAPNLPQAWIPQLSERWLSERIGLPVSLANDADLAAVGEATFGAGSGHSDVVYITISTGIGAGVVVGGRLVRGSRSGAEIGHVVIDRAAAAAGDPATVEDLGSGTAIARAAAAADISERDAEFADLVRSGHEGAVEIWNRALEAAGIGVAALAWMVVPTVIVVGGGVGRNEDIVQPVLRRQLDRHGPVGVDRIELATAALGDDAALAGGPAWWEAVGRA